MSKVIFSKPSIQALRAENYTCVDMHLHTQCSDDACFASITRILRRAKSLGIGIAITDHNKIDGALYACANSDGVLVIPGIEVKSYTGVDHLLYFYDIEELKRYFETELKSSLKDNPFVSRLSDEEVILGAKKYKCLVGAAHPFIFRCLGLPGIIQREVVSADIMEHVDCIEVLNREMVHKVNQQSLEWATALGKIQIAGSDAHAFFEVGMALTCVQLEEGEHFLDALQKREALLVGKERNSLISAVSFILGILKLVTRRRGLRMASEFLKVGVSLERRTKK